jgi:SNF family Na+-dependent transporter
VLSFYSVIGGWTLAYTLDPAQSYEALLAAAALAPLVLA